MVEKSLWLFLLWCALLFVCYMFVSAVNPVVWDGGGSGVPREVIVEEYVYGVLWGGGVGAVFLSEHTDLGTVVLFEGFY